MIFRKTLSNDLSQKVQELQSENEELNKKIQGIVSDRNKWLNLSVSLKREKTLLTTRLEEMEEDIKMWKQKYADELQKRLELAKLIEEKQNDNT